MGRGRTRRRLAAAVGTVDSPRPQEQIRLYHAASTALPRSSVPGLNDGPFPEHYEPLECPVEKNFMNEQRINPTAPVFSRPGGRVCLLRSALSPIVGTTYRVSEHWQTGADDPPPALAAGTAAPDVRGNERGVGQTQRVSRTVNGSWSSPPRGEVEARPSSPNVSTRLRSAAASFTRWACPGITAGECPQSGAEESANLLTPSTGDPNTRIPETKAFMVNIMQNIRKAVIFHE